MRERRKRGREGGREGWREEREEREGEEEGEEGVRRKGEKSEFTYGECTCTCMREFFQ